MAPSRCWSKGLRAPACRSYLPTEGYFEAKAEVIADEALDKVEAEALSRSVVST